jgi:hypothetical protein
MRYCDSWLSVSRHPIITVVVITISVPQRWPLIKSSSALSHRCSLGRRIRLDADVWLRVVESKFPLLNGVCSDVTKVRFAAQQLHGPARTWWDHFLAMQPVDHVVEWREFKAAFRGHHIPAGIMDHKLNEFLALTQGNRTVLKYA